MTTWGSVVHDEVDVEGSAPEVEEPFSYKQWGNFGFFHNTGGNSFSNDQTSIGKTEDINQIDLLDGQQVTIARAG